MRRRRTRRNVRVFGLWFGPRPKGRTAKRRQAEQKRALDAFVAGRREISRLDAKLRREREAEERLSAAAKRRGEQQKAGRRRDTLRKVKTQQAALTKAARSGYGRLDMGQKKAVHKAVRQGTGRSVLDSGEERRVLDKVEREGHAALSDADRAVFQRWLREKFK